MTDATKLSTLVSEGLCQHYERVRQKIHSLVDPLSEPQLWHRPYGYGNSVGHLLLHLTGNLSYYVGAKVAGTDYVRDRPKEFADDSKPPKDQVLRGLDGAVDLVLRTAKAQTPDDWHAPIEAVGADDVKDRFSMFVRCAAHFDHHTGQVIYLCKELGRAS